MEIILLCMVVNALVGYFIGKAKGAVAMGIFLSLLFGPLGWIVMALIGSSSRRCHLCNKGIGAEPLVCPHCHGDLVSR